MDGPRSAARQIRWDHAACAAYGDARLAADFLEGHRRDGAVRALLVGPDEARVRCHLEVLAVERYRLRFGSEHQPVPSSDPHIPLAEKQRQAGRFRHPPPFEQLWPGPGLEYEACRRIEAPRDHELAIGLPLRRREVLHDPFTSSFCVCQPDPVASVPREPCPADRSARPRADGIARSRPPLPRVGAARACRSAPSRLSP